MPYDVMTKDKLNGLIEHYRVEINCDLVRGELVPNERAMANLQIFFNIKEKIILAVNPMTAPIEGQTVIT